MFYDKQSRFTNVRIKAKWEEVCWIPRCVNGGSGSWLRFDELPGSSRGFTVKVGRGL